MNSEYSSIWQSAKFVHLRAQSSYSLLESANKLESLPELAREFNMPAVALCDRGNLFASLEFALACKKIKVQPIHGIILNITYADKQAETIDDFSEILIIAKDDIGYKNLLKLGSFPNIKNDRKIVPHITFNDLKEHHEGLIILSAYTKGLIGKSLLNKNIALAKKTTSELKEIFGDRFYFEIMRHGYSEEKQIESDYLELANEFEIPLVATNQILFKDQAMHNAHDVLLCISTGVVQEAENRPRVSNHSYFKSDIEMIDAFRDLPCAISNSINIARRCFIAAKEYPPSLPNFSNSDLSENDILQKEAEEGLLARLDKKFTTENIKSQEQKNEIKEKYFARLKYELGILFNMNFAGYFLIVSDFIKWSKNNGIAVGPGRGSGAGSIIAWSLEITNVDPIKFGLLFERFLNPERISMPDFDIDFCQERREEVIEYVRSKYGDSRVAQIITFGKMQAKAVIKDVARVLALPFNVANYITELVPFNAVNPVTLSSALEEVGELANAYAGKGLYNNDGDPEHIKQVLDIALVLEGLHRHASTHAAGLVIANQDIVETVPLYKDSTDSPMNIVQYSMKFSEKAGLVKFDFLGLQTLTVITKTLELLKKTGIEIDIDKIPLKHKQTFNMLSKGLGTGVFQFESVGMKSALKKLKPDCIEDIIALGALYRPGPMENIPRYIACKFGLEEIDFLHPKLKPILKETYGVIIYQEQVMEIAKVLSGYSLGSADLLRKAMGKKIKAEMDAQEEMFVNGALANKVNINQAKSIFATVAKFAGYGFNKSHATAYGLISYQTAYLKANYPTEFLVACLNLDIDNSDKVNVYIQEAKDFGIEIIPPSINRSQDKFTIENIGDRKCIIYAISAIKNVAKNFGKFVYEAREKDGNYTSIINFLERMPPKMLNKRLLENIVRAGCFDEFNHNRAALYESNIRLLNYCQSQYQESNSNQLSLIKLEETDQSIILDYAPWSDEKNALEEFEVFGLFLNNHPFAAKQDILKECNVTNTLEVKDNLQIGTHFIKIAGVIIKKDSRMSARGRFITLLISDYYGNLEVTIFSEEVIKKYNNLLNVKSNVIIEGDLNKDEGGIRFTARDFYDLNEYIENKTHDITLYIKNKDDLAIAINAINQSPNEASMPTNANIKIILTNQDFHYNACIDLNANVKVTADTLSNLQPFMQNKILEKV